MRGFFSVFWRALVSVAGVIGLYLGAAVAHLEWAFWITVGIALVIAIVIRVAPALVRWIDGARQYPALLRSSAELSAKLEEAQLAIARGQLAADAAMALGVIEGQRQVRGALLAAQAGVPEISGVAALGDEVTITASDTSNKVPLGARYAVVVGATGQQRGIVEVTFRDLERGVLYLACVEPTSPKFWQALADRVETDGRPPDDVLLEKYIARLPEQAQPRIHRPSSQSDGQAED